MIVIKNLSVNEITSDMLEQFEHRQQITKKWVYINEKWKSVDTNEIREWNFCKRLWIPEYLCQQIGRGGSAIAAMDGEKCVGFCSVDGILSGETTKYANLTMLFVDDRWKRKGIGRQLFQKNCESAAQLGAKKLFISAIPSLETIEFYFNMGCKDTSEIITEFVDTDQDRYLEFIL